MPIQTPICDFGQKAHDFKLKSTDNKIISLDDVKGENGTLIMFICNHCPYVKAVTKDIVEDCKKLSTMLIDFIEDPKSTIENYILEVSSPGIDRPLTSKEDFSYWAGSNIMMKLKKPINSLKKYEGTLKGFFNEKIEIDISGGHEENLLIEPETIKSINVVWSPETSQKI